LASDRCIEEVCLAVQAAGRTVLHFLFFVAIAAG
jgi:hypothetical protein